jgi:pimeloyl-ACP methyl ester carboxylesterase
MLIHGEKDQRFPLKYALELQRCFPGGGAALYIAEGADHSDSSKTPGYAAAIKSFLDRHLP